MHGQEDVMRSPMLRALLRELLAKMEMLAADGSQSHVDLRRLPLPSGGLEALRTWLGSGEIDATVTALGVTNIRETAFAGVWWVRHAKAAGDVFSEHLEIARSPALLAADPEEMRQAVEKLRSRLTALE